MVLAMVQQPSLYFDQSKKPIKRWAFYFVVLGADVISPEKFQGGFSHVSATADTNVEIPID